MTEKYRAECTSCKGTGRLDEVSCLYCEGRGYNYCYHPDAGPAAGCDHSDIDDNWGDPFCAKCGIPMTD